MTQGVELASQSNPNQADSERNIILDRLQSLILEHPVAAHPWFDLMRGPEIKASRLAKLLANYDAHATLLRRLLLKAATLMPEPAVGFILENVRNEYGNGNYEKAHQKQLLNLLELLVKDHCAGVMPDCAVVDGVNQYMAEVPSFYYPEEGLFDEADLALVSAGAVTATEILALEEFKALKAAFQPYGLANHIWFDHVTIEAEHANDSMDLVAYFIEQDARSLSAIEVGIGGVLMCNSSLYDGFLEAVDQDRS